MDEMKDRENIAKQIYDDIFGEVNDPDLYDDLPSDDIGTWSRRYASLATKVRMHPEIEIFLWKELTDYFSNPKLILQKKGVFRALSSYCQVQLKMMQH